MVIEDSAGVESSLNVDPFTLEIVRHKLFRVVDEGLITLGKVSGTSVTAEGHDVLVALYLSDGSLLSCGIGFLEHLLPASRAVKQILESFEHDPGIGDGDVFLANDPYTVAMHCPDIYMITPIFFDGVRRSWVVNYVHVTDIGGVDVGGFCPNAREVFHEGFSTPGLKIVENGVLRQDIYKTFLNMIRDPGMTGLDLKSQMAANFVVKERMHKIYSEYGADAIERISGHLINESEARFRRRLRELPDGTWRARKYLDLPDAVHQMSLAVTKKDDRILFDFSGTDPQADVAINCQYWHTKGEALAPVLPLLAWDITWNEGVARCLDIVVPEGSLLNAKRPAPISMNTVSSGYAVKILSNAAVSKMLAASPKYCDRAVGCWVGSQVSDVLGGENLFGEYVAQLGTDVFGMPEGARSFADGAGSGGFIANVALKMANVESEEQAFPKAFLYRRVVQDSGGAGKYRGGPAHERAVFAHGGASEEVTAVVIPGAGQRVPGTPGVCGGYPGATASHLVFRQGNAQSFPWSLESTAGEWVEDARSKALPLGPNDILYLRSEGGGGYGDPLDRDPERVVHDVSRGIVSSGQALSVYGVEINERGDLEPEATVQRRLTLRESRLEREVNPGSGSRAEVPRTEFRINEYLQLTANGERVQCTWCGMFLCKESEHWRDHVVHRVSPVSLAGPPLEINEDYLMWELFCPSCATALEVQVTAADHALLHDVIERWS